MKILHIGDNICGIPNTLVRAERECGIHADTISFDPDPQGHKSDFDFTEPSRIKRFMHVFALSEFYDTLIFTGDSIFWGFDIILWRLLRKKVALHYHGSEVRGRGPRFFHRFANVRFVSTPDLLEFVPDGVWLPNPIFVEDYKEHYTIGVVVVHAPTNRDLKGTDRIVDVVEWVKHIVPTVTFDMVEGLSHPDALEHYRKATLVVDQIKIGWYGMVALECMAMGVPVLCYIRDDLKSFMFEEVAMVPVIPPMCFTSSVELLDDLVTVLQYPWNLSLKKWADAGKEYVKRVHNPKTIVSKIEMAFQ